MMRLLRRAAILLPVLAGILAVAFLGRRVLGPDLPGWLDGREEPANGDLPVLTPSRAAAHTGEPAEVCGRVESARYVPSLRGRPTFLNFGRPYPDQRFTAVIWGPARARFDFRPERAYRGNRICVRGTIEEHEGVPQIEVRDPAQLRVRGPPGGRAGEDSERSSGRR